MHWPASSSSSSPLIRISSSFLLQSIGSFSSSQSVIPVSSARSDAGVSALFVNRCWNHLHVARVSETLFAGWCYGRQFCFMSGLLYALCYSVPEFDAAMCLPHGQQIEMVSGFSGNSSGTHTSYWISCGCFTWPEQGMQLRTSVDCEMCFQKSNVVPEGFILFTLHPKRRSILVPDSTSHYVMQTGGYDLLQKRFSL